MIFWFKPNFLQEVRQPIRQQNSSQYSSWFLLRARLFSLAHRKQIRQSTRGLASQVYALRGCMYYRDTNFTVEPPRKRSPQGTSLSVSLSGSLCYQKGLQSNIFYTNTKGTNPSVCITGFLSYRGYNFTVKPDKINSRFHRI